MVFCEEASNKLYFSKTDQTGAFIKSYTICEEVRQLLWVIGLGCQRDISDVQ